MSTTPFRIGVGGHQDLGNKATSQFVTQQFRAVLTAVRQHEPEMVVYSALARGADQLFVQIALDLGIPVEVVLPCAEYEANYATSQAALDDYRRLLHASRACHQLPFQHCSADAYLAAGLWIVDHSDLLVLAWNGLPPQGRSGTADMATYARMTRCPFLHLHTTQHIVQSYGDRLYQRREPLPVKREAERGPMEQRDSILVLPVWQGQKDQLVFLLEQHHAATNLSRITLPGGQLTVSGSEQRRDWHEQVNQQLRATVGFQAGRVEKLLHVHNHAGGIIQRFHLFMAQDLTWNPLALADDGEKQVKTFALKEALAATEIDDRCDPLAALTLLLYARKYEA